MKIEIGESLGYSYLRHVKGCWLVQTNWKASDNWKRYIDSDLLELAFHDVRDKFDPAGLVFKGTKNSGQFLKQAEIDVVGIAQDGSIHAMDVAFHEAGLNYVGGSDVRVLKKLLRTKLVLDVYHPAETPRHIYFVSPKVNRGVLLPLEEVFVLLRKEYPTIHWHLIINETFTNEMLESTLEKAETVSDTTELFMRSAKLLNLADSGLEGGPSRLSKQRRAGPETTRTTNGTSSTFTLSLQDIIQQLMRTVLEDHPAMLSEEDRLNLTNADYCRDLLGLQLGGFSLLRQRGQGRSISGHDRYYERVYAAQYFVSNNWWKRHHYHNAKSLIRFIDDVIKVIRDNEGTAALEIHRSALLDYLSQGNS